MNLNWLEGLIYGLISGLTEFLPVSSHAHQKLLLQLFGAETNDPVRDLFVHIALIGALYSGCRTLIEQFRREQYFKSQARTRSNRISRYMFDLKLLKNAAIPLVVGLLIISFINGRETGLHITAIFLVINGIILYIPERMMQGNKDASSMTAIDSFLIGIAGSASAITGLSRIGATTAVAVSRGSDRQHALNWAFLLSVPALITLAGLDFISIFAGGSDVSFWSQLLTYFLSAAGAYIGGYISIMLMKLLTLNAGFYGFAYYSWGAALFTFILYLIVA